MNHQNTLEQVVEKITSSAPPVVVLGVGIPGSGKSTLLNAVGENLSVAPVNVDEIRNRLMVLDWGVGALDRLDHQIASKASNYIANGGVALIDSPNCHAEARTENVALYRLLGARTIGAVWIDTLIEQAVSRDNSRVGRARVGHQSIAAMHSVLNRQRPNISEGFDWIVRISE